MLNPYAIILNQIDLILAVWGSVSTFMGGTLFSLVYLFIAERNKEASI